jgi:hypothetical protein
MPSRTEEATSAVPDLSEDDPHDSPTKVSDFAIAVTEALRTTELGAMSGKATKKMGAFDLEAALEDARPSLRPTTTGAESGVVVAAAAADPARAIPATPPIVAPATEVQPLQKAPPRAWARSLLDLAIAIVVIVAAAAWMSR